jgi:hypothetical protein
MTDRMMVRGTSRLRARVALMYLAWLAPAVLAAILNWSWWVVLMLLIPTVLWYLLTDGLSYYRASRRVDPKLPLIYRIPLLRIIPVYLPLCLLQGRFAGLIAAFSLIAVDEFPMRRIHRKPQAESDAQVL